LGATPPLFTITDITSSEYRKYVEKDATFERRFAQVLVNERSVPETINILRSGIREKYEVHHGVRILDGALISTTTFGYRYVTTRRLPDPAIDLVDEVWLYVIAVIKRCADHYSSVRITRETTLEAIDKLQQRKLELRVEIYALKREKDQASKERLATPRGHRRC